jgi:glycosyltransferase involved in cell wall biosynthesis
MIKQLLAVFSVIFFIPVIGGREQEYQKHIVVVTCSFNNSRFYTKNLDSILLQDYSNFNLIYIDDRSWDSTYTLVKEYIQTNQCGDRVLLISNRERKLALSNLYNNIHRCHKESIIVLVDGDDWLTDNQVLSFINQTYQSGDVWLTYGQFIMHPTGQIGFNVPYPQEIIDRAGFRYYRSTASHLRTFYAGLFHQIYIDDLMFQGNFFTMCYDLAIMFPMLEMARTHFKFIDRSLLIYNSENPLNDHKIDKHMQRKLDLIIRARTCYREISNPFADYKGRP